jgi:hypothetical protein
MRAKLFFNSQRQPLLPGVVVRTTPEGIKIEMPH